MTNNYLQTDILSYFREPTFYPTQRDILLQIQDAFRSGKRVVIVEAGTGVGKCLGAGTPILMYNGSIKQVQDIQAGDLLMGIDSKPRKVNGTTKGYGGLYRITPIKGSPFICNDVHILSLRCTATHARKYQKNEVINIQIDEYCKQSNKFKHMMKLWRTGVDFEKKELDIDPYFIGLWLGDGGYKLPLIYKTDSDVEICDYMKQFAKKYNTGLVITPEPKKNSVKWYFTNHGSTHTESWIIKRIRECCINDEKRIPEKYLVNNRDNRLKMLAGLLDTDGYIDHSNTYEITTKYKGLSEDILFLARSLGFAAYCKKVTKGINSINFEGEYYQIHVSGDIAAIPVLLERKKAAPRTQKKSVLNTGFSVDFIGMGDYYGFELDGDGLFLLGDFTVTHNSIVMRTTAEWLDTAHIVTMQKELQQQYTTHGDKAHRLPKVEGRISHRCLQNPSEMCNAGLCIKDKDFRCPYKPHPPITDDKGNVIDEGEFAFDSAKRGRQCWFTDKHCNYWQQKADAVNAKIVVHNYAYLLTEATYIGDFGNRELLGCDEAHNIMKVLSNFVGFSISIKKLQEYCESIKLGDTTIKFDDYHDDIPKWVELIDRCLEYFNAEYPIIEKALKEGGLGRDVERTYIRLKNELDELIPRLERFSAEYHENPSNWVINVFHGDIVGEVKSIELKPIDVAKYANKYLFYLGNKLLLMSATFLDPVKFCNNVGIPLKDVRYINAPSPFDPERAPIYAMNVGKYNNRDFADHIIDIANAIDSIMNIHNDQKGIIHCSSNRNRDMILNAISPVNKERLIVPTAGNKRQCMEKHDKSINTVLLSVSDEEGVDLYDDRSRFQIVTSLPFGNLGDAQIAARQQLDQEEYEINMLIRLIQESGRSVRNMNDYAFTYVLPSQFGYYIEKKFQNIFLNKPIYPSSFATFRARIKWNKEGYGRKVI